MYPWHIVPNYDIIASMTTPHWDRLIDDRGTHIGVLYGDKDIAPTVTKGGLGSDIDCVLNYSYALREQTNGTIFAIDNTKAYSLEQGDNCPPYAMYRMGASAMYLAQSMMPGMAKFAKQNWMMSKMALPYDITYHTDALMDAAHTHVIPDGGQFNLDAHSWSTVEALKLMQDPRYAPYIRKAILKNGVPGIALLPQETISPKVSMLMASGDRSEAWLLKHAGELYGPPFDKYPELILTSNIIREVDPVARERQIRCASGGLAIRSALGEIRTPVLIIGSRRDPITPLANSAALCEAIPGSKLKTGPDGHMSLAVFPEEVAKISAEWLLQDAT